MNDFSTAALAERLFGTFSPIFDFWQTAPQVDTSLREAVGNPNIKEILISDLKHIGMFLAAADAQGARSEFSLLAEYIVAIEQMEQPAIHGAMRDESIDRLSREIAVDASKEDTEHIYAPLCWRITQICFTKHSYSEAGLEAMKDVLIAIADHFALRDGNLTTEETERLKQFHAALS